MKTINLLEPDISNIEKKELWRAIKITIYQHMEIFQKRQKIK